MIHLHRAERADRLIAALADVVSQPAEDPLRGEMVAVPSRGIERWLQQELSLRLGASRGRRDGVCANVEFPFPGTVVGRALATAGGEDADKDPWSPNRLVWPLLETIDAELASGWLAPLRGHLGGAPEHADPTRRIRRFAAARHLADLYDRYSVHRPRMVLSWSDGELVDGQCRPLPADEAWQAELWRRLHRRLRVPPPVVRLEQAVAALHGGLDVPGLPPRLSVFGLTALPASYLRVLDALASHRDVHLFLLHPSPALWATVADHMHAAGGPARRREADRTRDLPRNPLLGSWSRDAREMQLVVAQAGGGEDDHLPLDAGEPTTLLERLQADIRADQPPPGRPLPGHDDLRAPLDPDDRSVQVHACHGKTRQVEVLRDAILHLLAGDPSLEPRDILVMCPDIEAFAPIVEAVFGARASTVANLGATFDVGDVGGADAARGAGAPLPDLRVRLADRAIRQTNPLLRVVADLLELAGARLTASEVIDLAGREPVRRRFRFDDEDLTRIERWASESGVRWGLHADHRTAFSLGEVAANTWRAGLDRILLGVAMNDEHARLVDGTVPLDDVEGADVDTAGRLAELLDRLDIAVGRLQGPHPVEEWGSAIAAAADLLTVTGERERWQHLQLHRILGEVVDEATLDGTPATVPLTLPESRALLNDRLRGRPSRANHRTGDLTVCTLVPMRSVPHRVICLLGMDDGAFPRRTVPDGDDLIDRDPHVGDRDPRTEDRQLLLDALLAATDCLAVTYTGQDVRTNDPRPPAVPVGELLDVVDRTVRLDGEREARAGVHVQHPLQPFDARNFVTGGLWPDGPWSFDPTALAGANARRQEPGDGRFLDGRLGPPAGDTVELADLVAFVEHPVRAFLRQRLDVTLPRDSDDPSDAIPVDLTPLERWTVGDRLLRLRRQGVELTRATAAERARGTLPPGALADAVVDVVTDDVEAIVAVSDQQLRERGAPGAASAGGHLDIDVELPAGRRIVGSVTGIAGDALLTVQYSKVGPKHRLGAWVRLLATTAHAPQRPWCALTIGRSGRAKPVRIACVEPLGPTPQQRRETALAELATLVDLHDRGMQSPLPLYCRTSAAYAEEVMGGDRDPREQARKVWANGQFSERGEPEHTLVLGDSVALDALLEEPPCDDEGGDGWASDERTRFGRYARRLWRGLAGHEEIIDCGRPE